MLGPLIGAGAAIAGGGALAYHAMAPRAQGFGATFVGGPAGSKQIALTYDDGPNDPHTLRLLDVLAKRGVRATFFLIGQFVKMRPDIARSVASAGHVIANHTYTHPSLLWCSATRVRDELERCDREIADATG